MAQAPELPEFDNPPVSEVAISIEFAPLANLRASDPPKFWASLRDEYPNFEVQPPVISFPEDLTRPNWGQTPPTVTIQQVQPTSQRYWFATEPAAWLVQVQRDRFVINWRKVTGAETYPRYLASVRPRLLHEWERFCSFIRQNGIGEIAIRRCEVAYVNDIPKDEGWRTLREAMLLLSPFAETMPFRFLPQLETLNFHGSFSFPDAPGRLHFAINHLLRQTDAREVLQLALTARSIPRSAEDGDVLACIDQCRSWIVQGFTDLTSTHAHTLWGRTR
jgi:uncharacterized protein (TIGR04255 family)